MTEYTYLPPTHGHLGRSQWPQHLQQQNPDLEESMNNRATHRKCCSKLFCITSTGQCNRAETCLLAPAASDAKLEVEIRVSPLSVLPAAIDPEYHSYTP